MNYIIVIHILCFIKLHFLQKEKKNKFRNEMNVSLVLKKKREIIALHVNNYAKFSLTDRC